MGPILNEKCNKSKTMKMQCKPQQTNGSPQKQNQETYVYTK